MNVVLDTNVVISGVFFGGVPSRILEAWNRGGFDWVVSTEVLEEYRRIGAELAVRYPARQAAIDAVLSAVRTRATVVHAPALAEPLSVDPDDDKFFALARTAKARVIVSGDRHVLAHDGWRRIAVRTPRAFVDDFGKRVGI